MIKHSELSDPYVSVGHEKIINSVMAQSVGYKINK